MTPEQKAAFIIAQSVAAFAEIQGMIAESRWYDRQLYTDAQFKAVIEKYGLHSNALLTFFND